MLQWFQTVWALNGMKSCNNMLYQEFTIPKYKWKVHAFYDTTFEDCEEIMDCLHSLGCEGKTAQKAFKNLSADKTNTGLTFSKNRQTCVVLGRATDRANFAHTYLHEIYHIGQHIANEFNISCQGEPLAYIIGDLAAVMLPYVSPFLCDHEKYNNRNT